MIDPFPGDCIFVHNRYRLIPNMYSYLELYKVTVLLEIMYFVVRELSKLDADWDFV